MDPNHGGCQDEQNPQNLGGYGLDGQNWGISVEDFESPYQLPHIPDSSVPLDSIWPNHGVAGTVPHGAPQGTSYEKNSLNGSHLQPWNFGNQSVAGTKQPAPGALEIAANEIQTLSSYDEELNEQQFNHLLADISGFLQLSTSQLGPPGASNSIDQLCPLPVSGTELPENQMLAGIQPLIQQQFGQAAEKELTRLERKRASDRAYRERVKEKKKKLTGENQALRAQIQKLEDQLQKEQQLREKQTKIEAEREYWKGKYLLLNERFENSEKRLRRKMKAMKKQLKNSGKHTEETEQVMMVKTVKETKNDD